MKHLFTPILACALAVLSSPCALAQWDHRQNIYDNMIDSRRDIRRTKARMEANRKKGRATTRTSATRQKGATARKVSTAPSKRALPPSRLELLRDSWQDFAYEAPNGFKAHLTFTSVTTGKTISKSASVKIDTGSQTDTLIEGIPAGTYTVRAEVAHEGTKYQAHLGSTMGSYENTKGGDFAPTFKIVFKPITNSVGSPVMGVFPPKIYVRVLEDTGVKWTKN